MSTRCHLNSSVPLSWTSGACLWSWCALDYKNPTISECHYLSCLKKHPSSYYSVSHWHKMKTATRSHQLVCEVLFRNAEVGVSVVVFLKPDVTSVCQISLWNCKLLASEDSPDKNRLLLGMTQNCIVIDYCYFWLQKKCEKTITCPHHQCLGMWLSFIYSLCLDPEIPAL